MTANGTLTSLAYVFKHMYDKGVNDEAIRLHPTIDMIPKVADFGGDSIIYSVKTGNAQNITSGTLATAQAVGSSSKGYQFTMVRKKKTGTITLDVEALLAAKMSSDAAFATLAVNEVDGFVNEFMDRLGFDLFRDGYGSRGQRSSISTNVITLATADDARNFKVGMLLGAAVNSDGTSPRTGSSAITAIDIDAGTSRSPARLPSRRSRTTTTCSRPRKWARTSKASSSARRSPRRRQPRSVASTAR
jgi:hypothetical protein